MFSSHPIAYLITFRTYGTWLPGDERGWVHRDANVFDTPFLAPRKGLRNASTQAIEEPAPTFDANARRIIEDALRDACAHRGWELRAVNVRTNHVHCVISADSTPEAVMRILKARATRLLHERRAIRGHMKPWSRHGSTIYLWNEKQLADACNYVMEYQGSP